MQYQHGREITELQETQFRATGTPDPEASSTFWRNVIPGRELYVSEFATGRSVAFSKVFTRSRRALETRKTLPISRGSVSITLRILRQL